MKREKKKIIILCLTVSVMIALTSVVYAEESGNIREKELQHTEKNVENLTQELSLTSEQQKQLKTQYNMDREKAKKIRETLRAKRTALKEELNKSQINRGKINALINDIGRATTDSLRQRVDSVLDVRKVLTAEQFQRLQEKQNRERSRHPQHR